MKTQEELWYDVEILAHELDQEMTTGYVRSGDSYSSCFPSETSYCSGVENAMERLIEALKEKYDLVEKNIINED